MSDYVSADLYHTYMNSIWEETTDGIVIVDLQRIVLDVNPAFEQMYGWTKEELVGRKLPVGPAHLYKEYARLYDQVIEGKKVAAVEYPKLCKNGKHLHVSITLSAVRDSSGKTTGIVAIERDITKRKQTEKALRETEQLYSHLTQNVLAGVFVRQDRKIVYINSYMSAMLGYTREEFVKLRTADYIDAIELFTIKRQVAEILIKKREPRYTVTVRGKKKDGGFVYLEVNLSLIMYKGRTAMLGSAKDVTSSVALERSLRESAEMYQRVMKLLPEPIVLSDHGKIIYANNSAIKLVQANDKNEVIGHSVFEYIHPDDHEDSLRKLDLIMFDEEPSQFEELQIICRDGQTIDVEMSSIRINNYMGKRVVLTVIRDLTDRKRSEDMLVRSEKLSVIGQLAAGVAHEIRNPLTALKGFTQLLKTKNEGYISYLDIMSNELDRINLIVNEFMTLAKPHFTRFNDENLVHILRGVISVLETQAIMTNVDIETQVEDCLMIIHADANQLKQVFINVIKNAIEAMPDGGRVTIAIRSNFPDSVCLTIRDEGIGMTDSIIGKIGQPFITTKEKGTGLGLMISSRIIEAHHGTLHINSRHGEGTEVQITLPLAKPIIAEIN
ncbi:two-component system, sporulation sensor kinase A [Paenibacillus algorifonticola]|uniref:histidine kinase n=1 Tax=Paenibacillus algorifonticola TaxID=684063 RepID=A0A1I2G0H5_9BACL|nr:PAS domain S-box protein [Paenibacillus algorifonticola]SFF10663.1 two-component system, sporulation sensor kinase A [Paenibacillus algorifonticola]